MPLTETRQVCGQDLLRAVVPNSITVVISHARRNKNARMDFRAAEGFP